MKDRVFPVVTEPVAVPHAPRLWGALVAVWLIWGSTYLAIRIMVRSSGPLISSGTRFEIAGLGILAFLAARRGLPSVLPARPELYTTVIGGVALALTTGLVAVAETTVPSSLAALLNASVALWLILMRLSIGREQLGTGTAVSVCAGFLGVAVLLLPGSRPAGATIAGMAMIVGAAVIWAAFTFSAPHLPRARDVITSAAWQMVCGGGLMVVAGLVTGEASELHAGSTPLKAWLAFAYLVLISSGLGFTCYIWLLHHAPVSLVGTYAYVNPLVAVVLGWGVAADAVGVGTLVGTALIAMSVAVTVIREGRSETVGPTVAETAPPGRA